MRKTKNRGEKRKQRERKVQEAKRKLATAENEERSKHSGRSRMERSGKGITGRPSAAQRDEALYRVMTDAGRDLS